MLKLLILFGLSQPALCDYYDLARQRAEAENQKALSEKEARYQRSIADFNQRITKLVYDFARQHRGFNGDVPVPEMNNLIPGRIAQYVFGTPDGWECAAESYPWLDNERDPAIIRCLHKVTGKSFSKQLKSRD